MIESPNKLVMAARHKRVASLISMNDLQALAHHCVMATCMFETLREVALAAQAQEAALNPASILSWLDDNAGQLNLSTFKPETSDDTQRAAS